MATQATTPVRFHPDGLRLASPKEEPRGYVEPKQVAGRFALEDLWIMQGSMCDLKCTHCYTASSPTNNRLEQITFAELRPHLDAAARYGVHKIYFTGGEVFVNEAVLRGRAGVVKAKLRETSGVAEAEVHYPSGHALVKYDPSQTDLAKLIETVNSTGYKASPLNQ